MKILLFALLLLSACNFNSKKSTLDNYKFLNTDSVNYVQLKDTMILYQYVCRGCAYEQSTSFGIKDTAGIVQLISVSSGSNVGSSNEVGGSVGKELQLVAFKKGSTIVDLYKSDDFKTKFDEEDRIAQIKIVVE